MTATPSTELTNAPATETPLAQLARITQQNNLATLEALELTDLEKDLQLAGAMGQMRKLISGPILEQITALAGSQLGFLTDRDRSDKPPYPPEVLRDAAIEALLQGSRLIGNEFNVISGKAYLAKNYYRRMLAETVTDLSITEGVPEIRGGTALVPMTAAFTFEGKRHTLSYLRRDDLDQRIQVRINSGMGPDAVSGKAFKKLATRIYEHCTRTRWMSERVDIEAADVTDPALPAPPTQALPAPSTNEAAEAFDASLQPKADQTPPPVDIDPETGEEIPASVQPEGPPKTVKQLREDLERLHTLSDVYAYHQKMEKLDLDGAQLKKLDAACKRRCDEIRAARGERSNGKQNDTEERQ